MSTTYLVTGANRGIGLAVVTVLASRPDVKIYATARNPSEATELSALADKHGNVAIHQLHSDRPEEATALAAAIEKEAGHIDYVLANAGTGSNPSSVLDQPLEDFVEDYKVNTLGPLILYRAIHKLLEQSKQAGGGVFIAQSTLLASITSNPPFLKATSYAASKAALNFIVKRIATENPNVKVLSTHPGWVKTRLGNGLGDAHGVNDIAEHGGITPEQSGAAIVKLIDDSAKYESGSFLNYDGTPIAW